MVVVRFFEMVDDELFSSFCCSLSLCRRLLISPTLDWYNSGGIVATFSIRKFSFSVLVVDSAAAAAVAELYGVVSIDLICAGSSQPVSKRRS